MLNKIRIFTYSFDIQIYNIQNMEKIEIQKFIALNEEFETANKLVRLGFGELKALTLIMISIFFHSNFCHKDLRGL